jgi:peptidoglycan/xylan/chitin deacetylase (PgdA/CDA1 family)
VPVAATNKIIALTFDDGPAPQYTQQILSILAQYQVKATFFQNGEHIAAYPALGRAVRDAGHAIGNHTWSHQQAPADPVGEVNRADAIIEQVYGSPTGIFRPPFGNFENGVVAASLAKNQAVIIWNSDPKDWAMPGTDVIARTVAAEATPGGIVLLHDGGGDRSQTVAALPTIIVDLKMRGFRFVTVPELLAQTSSAPAVSISSPGVDYSYTAAPPINGTAAATSSSDLSSVRALLFRYSDSTYWNGATWSPTIAENPVQGISQWSFVPPALTNGQYGTQAVARSSTGSATYTPWRNFFVDTLAPSVVVSTPKAEVSYSALRSAAGTASDNVGVQQVSVSLYRHADFKYWNGSTWTLNYAVFPAQGTTNWTAALPPLTAGRYSFEASARDYVGNTKYSGWAAFNASATAASATASAIAPSAKTN